MILREEEEGKINKDTIIVEPTSGNQGIGLALVGAVMGLPVKIIMPDSVSEERRKLIEQYGAEVELVHDDGNIGLCIENFQCVFSLRNIIQISHINSLRLSCYFFFFTKTISFIVRWLLANF